MEIAFLQIPFRLHDLSMTLVRRIKMLLPVRTDFSNRVIDARGASHGARSIYTTVLGPHVRSERSRAIVRAEPDSASVTTFNLSSSPRCEIASCCNDGRVDRAKAPYRYAIPAAAGACA